MYGMFFLLLLINATAVHATHAAHMEYNFNSLVRSKALETASSLLTDSEFLIPVFNDYEPRSERIIDKFRGMQLSKRNLKRMISALQKEWKSCVLSSETALGLKRRSGGVGPGADLHLTLTDPKPEADAPVDDYLDSASYLEGTEINAESLDQDLNTKSFQKSGKQSEDMGLKKRYLSADIQLILMTFLTAPLRIILKIVYDFFSPLFIDFFSDFSIKYVKAVSAKAGQDPDLLFFLNQFQDKIQTALHSTTQRLEDPHTKYQLGEYVKFVMKSGTAGVVEESLSHLPSKSSLQLGSLIFVAVPMLIGLVAAMMWNNTFN
jgi:hypothetical protein